MTTLGDPQLVRRGLRHLRRADPVMERVIRDVGRFRMRPMRERYQLLVRSMISQQISVAAARTIRERLLDLLPDRKVTPDGLAALTDEQFRSAGISAQKRGYLRNLTECVQDGRLNFRRVGQLSDEGVIEELTQVKGIGRWTAQMFLIFGLGRVDVFPPDDLGIRAAMRNEYDLPEMPSGPEACEIAESWRPYASIGSWYCWRSLD